MLQFGVAGALASQKADDTGVTKESIRTLYKEIEGAMAKSVASITVGVGGRQPSAKQSEEALAAAAATLGVEEGKGPASKRSRKSKDAAASSSTHPEVADLDSSLNALSRAQRERTSRFVQVGEDLVLKMNNYALHEGEQSVFDSELKGRQERPDEKDSNRKRAGVDYENQPQCQVCWGEVGTIVNCDFCPGAYHPACIGITDVDALPHSWSCPHHKCTLCGRRAHAAGGLLFRCTDCDKAYCEVRASPPISVIASECFCLLLKPYCEVRASPPISARGPCWPCSPPRAAALAAGLSPLSFPADLASPPSPLAHRTTCR